MFGKRPWKMAACAAAISLLVAGCGDGDADDASANANTIVIGIAEPAALLPTNVGDATGSQVLKSLFYPLVDVNAQNQPVEVAAEAIRPDKTNRVWTIKLKPGFTFHNGEKVTAQSYVDAWNYGAYGPNAQNSGYFFARIAGYAEMNPEDPDGKGPQKAPKPKVNKLSGLKVINELTFSVTLSAPFSGWKTVLAYSVFYPLPKAAFAKDGSIVKGFEEKIIGNGPFKMKGQWEHDDKIVVEKVADFKGQVPKIDGITWKVYQDQVAQYADLVSNNIDVQTDIPIESLSKASADLGDRYQTSSNSTIDFLGFPLYQPEYKNPDVRRAISMAINREEITNQIFLGARLVSKSFVSPVVSGYRENTCGESCDYNPSKARELYAAAGGPAEIKITYNVDGGHQAWVDAVCNQIRAILGVTCTGVQETKFAVLTAKARAREPLGLMRMGWVMDYPLMENYLGPIYGIDGSSNFYGYENAEFDELVAKGSEATTQAAAEKKWQEAEDMLAEDMPVIPLFSRMNVFGYSEHVQNVEMDLFSNVNLYDIETVA
ncbi:peptide ABC transporter substrate-binding protein [Actinoplanes utahensis]|uniref:4-phytase n=1 Tax=Actinoplanes utahensis TaxID=1869 RepID=A0A0A6UX74_ACTUT|nr:ABC transporter substrate-binding protein [Actinoplanes utahensis]KHD79034.1 4-phytase [Actinoplanes utahensis]GIF27962.1 putative peptide ABC transporter DppA [Actinoplanes utahensis]